MHKYPKALKAISSEIRYKILQLLMEKEGGMYVRDILKKVKIDSTLLSHHLKTMKAGSVLNSTRHGKSVLYKIDSKVKKDNKTIVLGKVTLSFN